MDLEGPLQMECIVTGPLAFMLYVSRILGEAPLSFKYTRDGWRVRASKISGVYGRALNVTFLILYITALVVDLTVDTETSFRTVGNGNTVVWIADLGVVGAVATAGAFTGVNRMRQMVDCLAKLKQITEELNPSQKPLVSSMKKTWLIILALLLSECFAGLLDYAIYLYVVYEANGKVVTSSFYLCYSLTCIQLQELALQFHLIAAQPLPVMKLLNENLRDILEEMYNNSRAVSIKPTPLNSAPIKKNTRMNLYNRVANEPIGRLIDTMGMNEGFKTSQSTLRRLSFLYCSLCDIIRQLNYSSGPLLLTLVMSVLLHLIITAYHLILLIFTFAPIESSSHLGLISSWAFIIFFKFLLIVEPCHQAHEQMILTKDLVNQMRRYTSPDDDGMASELKLFHKHIMLNQPTYSPLELFTLNRSIITAIIGSITTYLMVVIQIN